MKTNQGYTVKELLYAWKMFKANPDTGFEMRHDWPAPVWTLADWRTWFLSCLDRKINRDDPRASWRKMQPDYQRSLQCDRRTIQDYMTRNLRHTGCWGLLRTPELARRYPHINHQEGED